ncbi:MAG: hypothetical protein DDT26_02317 [Dehalococcoidia bacterium]|nr:hypothetical protein [Chloroflexota bacterium]
MSKFFVKLNNQIGYFSITFCDFRARLGIMATQILQKQFGMVTFKYQVWANNIKKWFNSIKARPIQSVNRAQFVRTLEYFTSIFNLNQVKYISVSVSDSDFCPERGRGLFAKSTIKAHIPLAINKSCQIFRCYSHSYYYCLLYFRQYTTFLVASQVTLERRFVGFLCQINQAVSAD